MRGRKTSLMIVLADAERIELERWVRCSSMAVGLVRRARMILAVARGTTLVETARQTGVTERIVRRWCLRFIEERLPGLSDRPRTGRPPVFSPDGGDARSEDRLRTPRLGRSLAVAVGLR